MSSSKNSGDSDNQISSNKLQNNEVKKMLSLDDIIDLTVVELYILNFLTRIGGSAVRFAVFNELNTHLERNKVSRSSFYHSLKKLSNKGFVEIANNPSGKGSVVSATRLAREAVKQSNIFSIWGNIDFAKISLDVIKKLADRTIFSRDDKIIFLSLDELVNANSLEKIADLVKKMYILADDVLRESLGSRNIDYPFSNIEEGIIREPNDFFDRGIISNYSSSTKIFNVEAVDLLDELSRVVKNGGEIIIISFDEVVPTNNIILDSVMKDLLAEVIMRPTNKKSIMEDFESVGIKFVEAIPLKGYTITIGIKK